MNPLPNRTHKVPQLTIQQRLLSDKRFLNKNFRAVAGRLLQIDRQECEAVCSGIRLAGCAYIGSWRRVLAKEAGARGGLFVKYSCS
jgi:hypothetical protein